MSEKCSCVHFEYLFNKIPTYYDSTDKKSFLENTTCELGRSKRKLDMIFVNKNGNIEQHFFVLKSLSKLNADVRVLKEYKWKKLSNIISLFCRMDISMDEFITFNK